MEPAGSYSRSVVVALGDNLSRYGCGQCRDLLQVCCAEVNLFRLPRITRLHRGCSPRATPGATDRELLPVRENELGPPSRHMPAHQRVQQDVQVVWHAAGCTLAAKTAVCASETLVEFLKQLSF